MELLFLALLYFLPSLVAGLRHHHQAAAIFLLNLLLGWTGIGWIGALVWSATHVSREVAEAPTRPRQAAETRRYCSQCGAALAAEVRFCSSCGSATASQPGDADFDLAADLVDQRKPPPA